MADSSRLRISDLILLLLKNAASTRISARPNGDSEFGEMLQFIAQSPDEELVAALTAIAIEHFEKQVAKYDAFLDNFDREPRIWADDVSHAKEQLQCAIQAGVVELAVDLQGSRTKGRTIAIRQVLKHFGSVLKSWEIIRAAAKSLQGSSFATAISRDV